MSNYTDEQIRAVLFGIPPKSVLEKYAREQERINREYEQLKASGASWWTRLVFTMKYR